MKTIRQILAFLIAAILAILKGIWRLFCAIFRFIWDDILGGIINWLFGNYIKAYQQRRTYTLDKTQKITSSGALFPITYQKTTTS